MVSRLGLLIARVFRAVMPDPAVIAVLLTVVTFVLAYFAGSWGEASGGERAVTLLKSWSGPEGLWKLLQFAMLMCLVLVTGHALAESPLVKRGLLRLSSVPKTTAQAAALVGLIACLAALINWGLGLIVGALLARDVGRAFRARGVALHYPLVAAAGYMGILVWHGGLSGSAPLAMTTREGAAKVLPREALERLGDGGAPLDQTLFSPLNLVVTLGLVVITPVVLWLLAPKNEADMEPMDRFVADRPRRSVVAVEAQTPTLPDRLETSPVIAWMLAVPLAIAVVHFGVTKSFRQIGLEEFCAAMLALGLIMHGSLRSYLAAAEEGARGCAGIILQFPLYGGIMAMLMVSGLVRSFGQAVAGLGGEDRVVLATYLSSCVTNFLVPSGGGQWAVQGPVALESGLAAGVPLGKMIMAVVYGGEVTDLLQPFWALPVLAITGVRARDIVGYTAVVMVVALVWTGVWLVVL